jgi:hypothetical protein
MSVKERADALTDDKSTSTSDDTTETSEQDDVDTSESDAEDTDSEEVDGEESDTEDSDDSAEDDEEDISKQYFTDPESLPKEVRGAFKKMQATFTRKMQQASSVIRQANAFAALAQDADFQEWLSERQTGKKATTRSTKSNEESEEDDDKPLTRSEMRKMLGELTTKQKEEESRRTLDSKLKTEAADFKKNNPGWELHKDAMLEVLEQHPTLSYQEAYALATRDVETSRKELLRSKMRGKTPKPRSTGGNEPVKQGKMSFDEAADAALRKLGFKK